MHVDLLVPMKPLSRAKTRLRGAADGGTGAPEAHAGLVLALARDALAAAAAAAVVRRAVAICSDELVCRTLVVDGVQVIPDGPAAGLNPALRYGEAVLRAADPGTTVAVLQADLPSLRAGTGTTLLLAPPGQSLEPCFGPGSAAAHRATGARELSGCWPGLRCDVDTAADLDVARGLGLGRFTRTALFGAGFGDFTRG
jgi:2-phospho-L-lactate guanylyltransferase